MKSVLTKIDRASCNSLDNLTIMGAFKQGFYANPLFKTNISLMVYKQVLDSNLKAKLGSILANCENEYEFSLENLHLQFSKLQVIIENTSKNFCIYAKLALPFFQENYSLTGHLSDNEGFAIVKKYSFIEKAI